MAVFGACSDPKHRRGAVHRSEAVCWAMARLAMALVVALVVGVACGDNQGPPPLCDGIELSFAYTVPLHPIARVLPGGDVLLAGSFRDTFTLGDQTVTSAGGSDVFIARIGETITLARYGDADDQELLELATNGNGDVAIAGKFRGALDLGAGAMIATGTTSSFYVARFDGTGALAFAQHYPSEVILRALAVSATGDVALAGTNFDPIDFGGAVLPTGDQFLGVLDAGGAHVASRSLAAEDLSVNLDVGLAFDGDELVVAGSYTRTIDLGGGPLTSAGELDLYVARFARSGAHRASISFGGPRNDGYRGFDGDRIAIQPVPDGVVLASSAQSADDEIDDVFVMRLDDAFAPIWNHAFAYPDFQAVGGLAVATDGTIAITGISAGATLAGSPGACGTADASHAFAATLDPDGGRVRWSRCFAADFAAGFSIAFRDTDELVIAGTFSGAFDLGLASENLSGFVAALRPACTK